jgi:hypothetical protein
MDGSVSTLAPVSAAAFATQNRYMDTPFLRAAFQVIVGRILVVLVGILIGSS